LFGQAIVNLNPAAGKTGYNDQMIAKPYRFQPVTSADLALLRGWLETPEVRKWWGDPDHELGLIKEDLFDIRMVNCLVCFQERPFAYAQHYEVHTWPADHFAHLPRGSRAIDTFIGDPEMFGAGHGSGYLRQLAEMLIVDGAPEIAIDPDPDNHRARRAYEKAGFSRSRRFETSDGPAMVMLFTPKTR
jgi:aminoglycoside 6'-N-acetyltransferase